MSTQARRLPDGFGCTRVPLADERGQACVSMKNRRNYYRLLHVQPDAPLAIIKSSYCALMLKLKQHPDLGGDHETAALLNEAHAVLTDPAKRADYDRYLAGRQSKASVGSGPLNRPADTPPSPPPRTQEVARPAPPCCRFCSRPYQGAPSVGTRCTLCASPLAPPIRTKSEGADQRAVQRFARGGEVALLTRQTLKELRATIQDLSATGMCVIAKEPLAVNQVVKIDGTMLSAVARVVSCRRQEPPAPGLLVIGVEFLTLEFVEPRGTFVSRWT